MTRREALARHPLAILGALITTASAVAFVAMAIAVLAGLFENPYAGLVVFIALPVGLLFLLAKQSRRSQGNAAGSDQKQRFPQPGAAKFVLCH